MSSGPNYLLFSDVDRLADSLWDRFGVGWSPRPHALALGTLQRALDREVGGLVLWPDVWLRTCTVMYLPMEAPAYAAVGDCTRQIPTLGDPRETSGPRIDRLPSTRPPWWRRQYRELKKLFFSAPSKCPIVLFGPVSNRTILKQLHVTFESATARRPSREPLVRREQGFGPTDTQNTYSRSSASPHPSGSAPFSLAAARTFAARLAGTST